jgi:hypothetical protein
VTLAGRVGRLVLHICNILHDGPVFNTALVHDHEEFWLDEEFWAAWHPKVFGKPEVFIKSRP